MGTGHGMLDPWSERRRGARENWQREWVICGSPHQINIYEVADIGCRVRLMLHCDGLYHATMRLLLVFLCRIYSVEVVLLVNMEQ